MKSLPNNIKIGVLKGISSKINLGQSKLPGEQEPVQVKRKIDPDYMHIKKYDLSSKLFKPSKQ